MCSSDLELVPALDQPIVWQPSPAERRNHPALPAEARITGRLISARPEGLKEDLYLFTTLSEPADEVVALYKERWHIETDLRSLKQEVRLQQISARSPSPRARR